MKRWDAGDFAWEEALDGELLARRTLTVSVVAALPEDAQADIAKRVRALAARLPKPLRVPHVTKVFVCYRAP